MGPRLPSWNLSSLDRYSKKKTIAGGGEAELCPDKR
jgi:hypothetical protein